MIERYTNPIDFLGKYVKVKIDRPIGSKHEKNEIYYAVNYGFVPGTVAPDGDEVDVYVLGVFTPIDEFVGKCIAVIHRINYNDDKLIVVPENMKFTDEEIRVLTEFQERFFKSEIIREENFE